jgi:L-alanine-DL-glutamate epimerase-like enolase superfamily enzyme
MKLEHDIAIVTTTHPFVIARGGATEHRLIRVRLIGDDGVEGWGEASPNRFYGETVESAIGAIERFRPIVEKADAWAIADVEQEMNAALRFNGSVKSAISAALHDLAGKRLGVPVYKLWGLNPEHAPPSSFTIAIASTAQELTARVKEAAPYPILKIKLGTDRDAEIMNTVRAAAPDKVIRVDANAAWDANQAIRMIVMLMAYNVEYVEQPVALHDINIKLSKCGGLREALAMIATARAHGLRVMAGCMIETSLGITAAAHFAPLLDYADLDGAALLTNDPYWGATIEGGRIRIPDAPGLGVTARSS